MTDDLGQDPKSVEEKVWFLITKGEYEACVELGNAAVPVLLDKLKDRSPHVAPAEYKFLNELPAARICDHAMRALLSFGWEVGLSAIQRALADADNLLKAHAINGLENLKKRILGIEPHRYISQTRRRPPGLGPDTTIIIGVYGEEGVTWDEAIDFIDQQGITKLLGELTLDTSPVIEEGLLPTFLEESERLLFHDLPAQAFDSETEAELAKFQVILRSLWQRPIGCHGIQGLSVIRTPDAIRFLLSALESSEPDICADAIGALGKWLGDFPDSGWLRRELILITPEVEQLREVTIDKLIGLLQNKTLQVQDRIQADALVDMGIEVISIGECAAEALTLSGTQAAKSALESWRRSVKNQDGTVAD